jgi:hypothetical protein
MDLSKVKTSDWVIGVSAIVLFIASFLDWFTAEFDGDETFIAGSVSVNAWDVDGWFFWAFIPVVLGIASLVVVLLQAFSPQTELPKLPIGWGQAQFIAGAVAGALVLLKFLIGEDAGDLPGVDVSRSIGIFLALLAGIGLAVGGWLKWQDERSGTVASTGTTPPTPF